MVGEKWHVVADWSIDGMKVYRTTEKHDGRYLMAYALPTLTKMEPYNFISDGGIELTADAAQQLMDGLWRAGVRPKNGAGALAHVEALQAHIADLRLIAIKPGA